MHARQWQPQFARGAAGLCTDQVSCVVGLERKALQRFVKLLSCVGCCALDSGQAKVGWEAMAD